MAELSAIKAGECMAMAINVGYFIKEAITNFNRNWVMSLGAVITIYLSLLLVGVSMVVGAVVNDIVREFEDKVSIQVFIKDGAATEDVQALQSFVRSDPLVRSVEYTSKDEALNRFREQWAASGEIMDVLERNPLPASLDVELIDPRQVETMANNIKTSELFLRVADRPEEPERSLAYGAEIIDQLFAFTGMMRIVSVVFIVMLASVSLIFISNTIRLAIHARRKEIGIMRLVGASNWFIRTPFLLEGVIQSLVGAFLAIATLTAMYFLLIPRIKETLLFLPINVTEATMVHLSLMLIAAGIVIGLLGSGVALRRYLRV